MKTVLPNERATPEERLEALFKRHYKQLAAYAHRRYPADIADDVVAETLLVAWRRIDHVPPKPLPWLLGVARKVGATQLRSRRRRASLKEKLGGMATGDSYEAPLELVSGESPVVKALMRLSTADREALQLIAWDELAPAEAAKVVGVPAAVFRVRLHRARKKLARELERSSSETGNIEISRKVEVNSYE